MTLVHFKHFWGDITHTLLEWAAIFQDSNVDSNGKCEMTSLSKFFNTKQTFWVYKPALNERKREHRSGRLQGATANMNGRKAYLKQHLEVSCQSDQRGLSSAGSGYRCGREGEERLDFLQLRQGKGGREADLVSLSLQSLDLRNKEGWKRERERERTLMALSHWQQHVTQILLLAQQLCRPKRKL